MTRATLSLDDRRPIVAALLIAAAILIYRATHWDMVQTWLRSDTFGHCFLIPAIAAFLVWRLRNEISATKWTTSYAGLLALAGLAVLWLAGEMAALEVVKHSAAVAMIPTIALALFGAQVGRILLFPAGYLMLAVPFGEWAIEPLMEFTADFAVGAVQLFGLPIYREGYFFSLPAGNFEVAKACSGIRYTIAGLALALLYGYLTMRSAWRIAGFVATAVVLTVVANGVRATAIVLIANATNLRLAAGVDHLIYGWLFFGIVSVLIVWMARFFEGREPARDGAQRGQGGQAGRAGRPVVMTAAVLAVMLAGPALRAAAARDAVVPGAPIELPLELGAWRAGGDLSWAPRFVGAEASQLQTYGDGARAIAVFAARYGNAWRGSELVSSENRLFPAPEWREIGRGTRSVAARGRSFTVNTIEITDGRTARLVWYWYVVGEREHDAPWAAKLAELWLGLKARDAKSAVVAVATATDSAPGRDGAATALTDLLDAHYDRVVAAVFPTRAQRAGRNGS